MNNPETILRFLKGIPNGACDDCISRQTGIEPRQQVNQICRRIEQQRTITRRRDRCAVCGHTKTVNITRGSGSEAEAAASPRAVESVTAHDAHVRAKLICGKLDLNEVRVVDSLLQAAAAVLSDPAAWHRLEVYRGCYFRTPDGRLP